VSSAALISCLVPTRPSRRHFWPALFRYFRGQSWTNKKMLLIDEERFSGDLPPNVDHLVVNRGTSIGEKLNIGVESSSSADFFHKWDDDDGYRSNFLEDLVDPLLGRKGVLSIVDKHLVFLIKAWRMYVTQFPTLGGGTICFDRELWKQRKFKDLSLGEDQDFLLDRRSVVRVTPSLLNYVLVRHEKNTWKTWSSGKTVEDVVEETGTFLPGGPGAVFSEEDLRFYRSLVELGSPEQAPRSS
jgi:O-antigen biosynthesis protein